MVQVIVGYSHLCWKTVTRKGVITRHEARSGDKINLVKGSPLLVNGLASGKLVLVEVEKKPVKKVVKKPVEESEVEKEASEETN